MFLYTSPTVHRHVVINWPHASNSRGHDHHVAINWPHARNARGYDHHSRGSSQTNNGIESLSLSPPSPSPSPHNKESQLYCCFRTTVVPLFIFTNTYATVQCVWCNCDQETYILELSRFWSTKITEGWCDSAMTEGWCDSAMTEGWCDSAMTEGWCDSAMTEGWCDSA